MNAAQLRKRHGRLNGECTWCGKPVGPGRQTWCGQECVAAFRAEHDWTWIRGRVEERDRGVCAVCGVDTRKIKRLLNITRQETWGHESKWSLTGFQVAKHLADFYKTLGWDDLYGKDLWQADHINPRVRGGDHKLDNLRTLCVPCHKTVTAQLAADRKAERRAAKRLAAEPLLTETLCHRAGSGQVTITPYQEKEDAD